MPLVYVILEADRGSDKKSLPGSWQKEEYWEGMHVEEGLQGGEFVERSCRVGVSVG